MKIYFLILALLLSSCGSKDLPVEFGAIEAGHAKLVEIEGKPYFIYAVRKVDFESLSVSEKYVSEKTNIENYVLRKYFVVEAFPKGGGCLLKFFPANGKNWNGGYLDQCKDTNYDILGRAINVAELTLNNYPSDRASLVSPKYELGANGALKIWPN